MTAPLSAAKAIVDDRGVMARQMRTFMNAVSRLFMLTGSGSPEGIVEARQRRLYLDTAGTAGSILYIKQVDSVTRDKKLGWILV